MKYKVLVENDNKEQLSFPKFYSGKEDITIVEPVYNFLKSGEKIIFKIISDLDKIIIVDQMRNYIKKNEQGFFEFETIIQSSRGEFIKISNNSNTLVKYNVI